MKIIINGGINSLNSFIHSFIYLFDIKYKQWQYNGTNTYATTNDRGSIGFRSNCKLTFMYAR